MPKIRNPARNDECCTFVAQGGILSFLSLFCKHLFEGIHGLAVHFLQGVGVDVYGGGCLGVAQTAGYRPHIHLVTGNQQRGRGVPQAVKRDRRELLCFRLPFVVPLENVLQGGVWGRVGHLLSVMLDEDPGSTLPIIAQAEPVAEAVRLKVLNPSGQACGDADHSPGVLRLRGLCDLLARHNGNSLCDADCVVFKVNIRPFQGQQLAFTQTGINRQVEQDTQLLRDFLLALIISDRVGPAGIISPLVALRGDGVGLFNEVQENDPSAPA